MRNLIMNKVSHIVTKSDGALVYKSDGTYIDNHTDYVENKEKEVTAGNEGAIDGRSNVISLIKQKFPDLSDKKIIKYYNTYCNSIKEQLLKRLPFLSSSITSISLDKLWYHKFHYNNVRYYIYREFSQIIPYFSLVNIGRPETIKPRSINKNLYKVNTNNTIIMLNQKLIDQLIDNTATDELVSYFYTDIDMDTLECVDVDMYSLNNFINQTKLELTKNHKEKHTDKLYRNLRQAKYIKMIVEFFYPAYGKHVLPMIPYNSKYGRRYYKGINIQNVSVEVRQAIIGEHYSYDINAAVYSIKLLLARKILAEKNISDVGLFTYTKEYLDYKSAIRIELAKHIHAFDKFGKLISHNESVKLVKQAITAIGFGARISGGVWKVNDEWHYSTLNEIIKNPEDRKHFLNDPWVKEFVKEQHQLTHLITNAYIGDTDFVQSVIDVPNMFENNKIRKSQVMAYLFQHVEYEIMNIITSNIPVVCRIHDSFITKQKLSSSQLLDIKTKLLNMDRDLSLSETYHSAWHDPQLEKDILEHKQFIQQQEELLRVLGIVQPRRKSVLSFEYV